MRAVSFMAQLVQTGAFAVLVFFIFLCGISYQSQQFIYFQF